MTKNGRQSPVQINAHFGYVHSVNIKQPSIVMIEKNTLKEHACTKEGFVLGFDLPQFKQQNAYSLFQAAETEFDLNVIATEYYREASAHGVKFNFANGVAIKNSEELKSAPVIQQLNESTKLLLENRGSELVQFVTTTNAINFLNISKIDADTCRRIFQEEFLKTKQRGIQKIKSQSAPPRNSQMYKYQQPSSGFQNGMIDFSKCTPNKTVPYSPPTNSNNMKFGAKSQTANPSVTMKKKPPSAYSWLAKGSI